MYIYIYIQTYMRIATLMSFLLRCTLLPFFSWDAHVEWIKSYTLHLPYKIHELLSHPQKMMCTIIDSKKIFWSIVSGNCGRMICIFIHICVHVYIFSYGGKYGCVIYIYMYVCIKMWRKWNNCVCINTYIYVY